MNIEINENDICKCNCNNEPMSFLKDKYDTHMCSIGGKCKISKLITKLTDEYDISDILHAGATKSKQEYKDKDKRKKVDFFDMRNNTLNKIAEEVYKHLSLDDCSLTAEKIKQIVSQINIVKLKKM